MLKPGQTAPDFTLSDASGNPVRLETLLTGGPLVLYFYPADFTPLCTKQACMMRDRTGELTGAGAQVVGISSGSAEKHARFSEQYDLPFTLLADPGRKVAKQYDATVLGLLPRRVSYLIGTDGKVLEASEANFSLAAHARFVDRALERVNAQGGSA